MKKNTIMAFLITALLSACSNPFVNDILPDKTENGTNGPVIDNNPVITININKTGNETGDSVTASPGSGKAGDEITINYALAKTKVNNRLVFSGTTAAIAQVDSTGKADTPETGTRKYVIVKEDSAEGVITINVIFTHTDKQIDTIAFAGNGNETKTYGDAPFTKEITNTGSGTGAITYVSSNTTVATVNSTTGEVTILKIGTTTITATKAADATWEQATAAYTLTVTKAVGAVAGAPSMASRTTTSITVNAVIITTNPGGQTVEYAISTSSSTVPSTGWQDGLTFNGLTANTTYYVYARAKANDNYNTGTASRSSGIKTDGGNSPSPVPSVVNFEADAVGKTYGFTKGGSSPTVAVVNDPHRSGQKSVKITSSGYNQAAVIPINLPYELENYKSFSFKFSLISGNSGANLTNQQILVYVAKTTTAFKDHGFGNAANNSGGYNEFEANKLGEAPSPAVSFDDAYKTIWTDYSITITNPNSEIKGLKGDIFVAIGINCQNAAEYLFDDLTFTPKDDFIPPAPLDPPFPPSLGAASGGEYRNMFKELGKPDAEITTKVNTAFNKLFNGSATEKIYYEVVPDMAYILDSGNNDVRSEGMSYGMMMCVQLDKKTEFDRLWKWARTYMYNEKNNGKNSRGYFSWQCGTDGHRMDANPAPDGEEYFITALLFAHARWGSASSGIMNYKKEARQIIYDLTRRRNGTDDPPGESDNPPMFNTGTVPADSAGRYMVRFVPYAQSGKFTDPSYHLPAFYEVWALELQSDYDNNNLYDIWSDKADLKKDIDFFKQAATVSRSFFQKTTNATTGLGPDYADWDGTARNEGDHKYFEYDAWRIAMNIGMDYAWWAKDSWQKTFADRIQAFFVSKGVTTYGNRWTLDGTQRGADHSPGLVGCNAVASLAATHSNAWEFIEDFWNISMTTGQYRYYDGCLYMLSMLHLSGNFRAYLTTNTTPVPSSSISPTSATFDKKTSQQTDIPVTMTLNGNNLTSISNGAVTLTKGTDYTESGSNVTIKKSYLSGLPVGTTTLVFTFSAGSARNLVITVVDTSNSSITPTTATFDKRSDLQKDITVNMTLNGNNLTSISNGAVTLTIGTDYTKSDNNVTIKKEYLANQAVGTTTLVFTFNAGAVQNLVITVKESPQGGGTGTKYDFANGDTITADYPKYGLNNAASTASASGLSAEIVGTVLRVTKTTGHSSPRFILPFDLGTGKLSDYSKIEIILRPVSGDLNGGKSWYARAGITSTQLGTASTNLTVPGTATTTIQMTITNATSYTGVIEIGFEVNNTNPFVYEITSIELIP